MVNSNESMQFGSFSFLNIIFFISLYILTTGYGNMTFFVQDERNCERKALCNVCMDVVVSLKYRLISPSKLPKENELIK